MKFVSLFEDHLKLAVRLKAGSPLRADRKVQATPQLLSAELEILDGDPNFKQQSYEIDETSLNRAKYAVNALIDSSARQRFGQVAWKSRTGDAHVGHNFYTNLVAILNGRQADRPDLLELYALCELLGIDGGDVRLRAQEDVRRALNEAVSSSLATRFQIDWPDVPLDGPDTRVKAAHWRGLTLMKSAAALFLIGLLSVYVVVWIGFPRI